MLWPVRASSAIVTEQGGDEHPPRRRVGGARSLSRRACRTRRSKLGQTRHSVSRGSALPGVRRALAWAHRPRSLVASALPRRLFGPLDEWHMLEAGAPPPRSFFLLHTLSLAPHPLPQQPLPLPQPRRCPPTSLAPLWPLPPVPSSSRPSTTRKSRGPLPSTKQARACALKLAALGPSSRRTAPPSPSSSPSRCVCDLLKLSETSDREQALTSYVALLVVAAFSSQVRPLSSVFQLSSRL